MLTERHVQAIWYDAALRPRNLVTRRGSEVRVLSPGEWNGGAGPDFRQAVLEIGRERRRLVGDVEVHLAPRDWDLHAHGVDPNYRNVIAHVTWRGGPGPTTIPPDAVSIWLGRFMTSRTDFSPDQIDLSAYPLRRLPLEARPCETRVGHALDRARELLLDAGRVRLKLKARRLEGILCERMARERGVGDGCVEIGVEGSQIRRQVFYEELMAALGYVRNTTPFRRVAERVPIEELPTECEPARSALLTAGTFETWDRRGIRPWNSPERRLASAAGLLTETAVSSFADAGDFSSDACRAMLREMRRGRFLGKGRGAAILANVIVPFAVAEGRLKELPKWLPCEDISEPVRLTAFRLFGPDHNPATAYADNGLLVQGLIHIHHEFCRRHHPACDACDVGSTPNVGSIPAAPAKPPNERVTNCRTKESLTDGCHGKVGAPLG